MSEQTSGSVKRTIGVTSLAVGALSMLWSFLDWRYYALAPIGLLLIYVGLRVYPDPRTRRLSRWMLWAYLALIGVSIALGW